MDPSTSAWAAARLSPVQMVIWGHPSTTGFDSIDYYLSSELFYRHAYQPSLPVVADPATATAAPLSGFAQDSFLEQLVQFDTLGFYFERPKLEASIAKVGASMSPSTPADEESAHSEEDLALIHRPPAYYKALRAQLKKSKTSASAQLIGLISRKTKHNTTIALCPQHMPKFHPNFDIVLTSILLQAPNSVIALIDNKKKFQWRRTLTTRWRQSLTTHLAAGNTTSTTDLSAGEISASGASSVATTTIDVSAQVEALLGRIVWVDSLTPQEYLTLLAFGDVMLDPFPFGGGVTTLESVAVCTPVITLPVAQSVPQLAAGE